MQGPQEDATPEARDALDSTSGERWQQLSEPTIGFGHQSVGSNIIDGLEAVASRYASFELPIVELSAAEITAGEAPNGPGLFHFAVGRNKDPQAKISNFHEVMSSELGRRARIALLKFCYVDFGYELDPDAVFEAYAEAIHDLRLANPNTRFLHATSPLTVPMGRSLKGRVKDWVKTLIGRPVYSDPNVARNRYSARIIDSYAPDVFDIARIESTGPDGSRALQRLAGEDVYFMFADWTNDGGHLSAVGKERAAEVFLRALLDSLD